MRKRDLHERLKDNAPLLFAKMRDDTAIDKSLRLKQRVDRYKQALALLDEGLAHRGTNVDTYSYIQGL